MIDLCESGQILYISSIDVSVGNGPGVNEREFILALRQAIGDRAHFVIPRPVNAIPELPAEACTFSLPHRHHNPGYWPGHVFSTMWAADRLLSQRHFDLLIFRLDILPFNVLYITKKYHVPYALKTLGQGMINVLKNRVWLIGPIISKINLLVVENLVNRSIATDTVSQIQLKYLGEILNVYSNKILYIDNAVNTKRFYPISTVEARRGLGLEHYDPIVGYAGNYPHERGGIQLLNAAPMLLPRYPNLGLVILGNGDGRQHLTRLAAELGIEQHCLITGHVPFDQVPMYINTMDVGVSIQKPEGFGMSEQKVRQYLACGKPVIASTPGSNDFLADENLGSLVRQDDINSIANELDRWLALEVDERVEFSGRASQYARDHLSVERSIAKRIALWSERLNF
jgi:glycosyltransferase involved in cell wall biosynthesis